MMGNSCTKRIRLDLEPPTLLEMASLATAEVEPNVVQELPTQLAELVACKLNAEQLSSLLREKSLDECIWLGINIQPNDLI